MHWIGVDVGGTFTDVVVYDEATGALDVAKSPITRADPTVGLLNALGRLSVSPAQAGRRGRRTPTRDRSRSMPSGGASSASCRAIRSR